MALGEIVSELTAKVTSVKVLPFDGQGVRLYLPNNSIDFMMCSYLSRPTCMIRNTWSAPSRS